MTKAEKEFRQRLVDLGCIVCRVHYQTFSPAQIHHIRAGMGVGMRNDDKHAIPLCPLHHLDGGYGVALHAGQKEWESRYGSEEELLEKVKRWML